MVRRLVIHWGDSMSEKVLLVLSWGLRLSVVDLPDLCVKVERVDLPVACNGIAKGGSESLEVFGFEFHE